MPKTHSRKSSPKSSRVKPSFRVRKAENQDHQDDVGHNERHEGGQFFSFLLFADFAEYLRIAYYIIQLLLACFVGLLPAICLRFYLEMIARGRVVDVPWNMHTTTLVKQTTAIANNTAVVLSKQYSYVSWVLGTGPRLCDGSELWGRWKRRFNESGLSRAMQQDIIDRLPHTAFQKVLDADPSRLPETDDCRCHTSKFEWVWVSKRKCTHMDALAAMFAASETFDRIFFVGDRWAAQAFRGMSMVQGELHRENVSANMKLNLSRWACMPLSHDAIHEGFYHNGLLNRKNASSRDREALIVSFGSHYEDKGAKCTCDYLGDEMCKTDADTFDQNTTQWLECLSQNRGVYPSACSQYQDRVCAARKLDICDLLHDMVQIANYLEVNRPVLPRHVFLLEPGPIGGNYKRYHSEWRKLAVGQVFRLKAPHVRLIRIWDAIHGRYDSYCKGADGPLFCYNTAAYELLLNKVLTALASSAMPSLSYSGGLSPEYSDVDKAKEAKFLADSYELPTEAPAWKPSDVDAILKQSAYGAKYQDKVACMSDGLDLGLMPILTECAARTVENWGFCGNLFLWEKTGARTKMCKCCGHPEINISNATREVQASSNQFDMWLAIVPKTGEQAIKRENKKQQDFKSWEEMEGAAGDQDSEAVGILRFKKYAHPEQVKCQHDIAVTFDGTWKTSSSCIITVKQNVNTALIDVTHPKLGRWNATARLGHTQAYFQNPQNGDIYCFMRVKEDIAMVLRDGSYAFRVS